MSRWDSVRSDFARVHDDLFSGGRYEAEFFNTSQGDWDPDADEMTAQTRKSIGVATVELVPPSQDSSIDQEGTSFDWATSIRFPESQGSLTVSDTYTVESGTTETYDSVTVEAGATLTVNGTLVAGTLDNDGTVDNNGTVNILSGGSFAGTLTPLGEDSERPTEVELTDQVNGETELFELHSYTTEVGSGMIMARLQEQ